MFLTPRGRKLWWFTCCTIHSPTCDSQVLRLAPVAEGSPPSLQIRLTKPDFKNTPLNYIHTQKTAARAPVVLFPHFPYIQKTRRTSTRSFLLERACKLLGSHSQAAPAPLSTTETLQLCLKHFSLAMYLRDRRYFHPHLGTENQNQRCTQLPAHSWSRRETRVLCLYLKPLLSLQFVHPFCHLLTLTPSHRLTKEFPKMTLFSLEIFIGLRMER